MKADKEVEYQPFDVQIHFHLNPYSLFRFHLEAGQVWGPRRERLGVFISRPSWRYLPALAFGSSNRDPFDPELIWANKALQGQGIRVAHFRAPHAFLGPAPEQDFPHPWSVLG